MSRHIVTAVVIALLALAAFATGAIAGDIEGKIQSVDPNERSIVLDNGTKVWLPDGIAADDVREGVNVRVSYDERDGKNVATSIEVR